VREAKEQTSWGHPSQEYESALTRFVTAVLQSEQFRADFLPFQRQVSYFGMLNSLAQTLLKLTVPGVPDLYQGNELWEFNLVDPDNRRAIDYPARERMLRQLMTSSRLECGARSRYAQELAAKMEDSRIKMYVIWKGLNLRKSQPLIFQDGDYLPLRATGEKASHVIALARITGESCLLVAVPRHSARLVGKQLCLPIGADVWGETELRLPVLVQNSFRNLFTGELLSIEAGKPLQLSSILAVFPVALLMSEKSGKIAKSNFQSAR
jgi:(1->4)-alpha-D-glucan 1-alpha-D-glucosylmutase